MIGKLRLKYDTKNIIMEDILNGGFTNYADYVTNSLIGGYEEFSLRDGKFYGEFHWLRVFLYGTCSIRKDMDMNTGQIFYEYTIGKYKFNTYRLSYWKDHFICSINYYFRKIWKK